MKLFKSLFIASLFLISTNVFGRVYYFNYAQQGGARVLTSGSQSLTQVQRSFPNCTVTVYAAGTTTLVPLFSDNNGTNKANPFTAGSDGSFSFWTDSTNFDIKFSGTGITTSCGLTGQLPCISPFTWPSAAGVSGQSSFDVRTCTATGSQLAVLGNGFSKPLSGFYSTLVAAQVDYPEVTSLTDELDWAVLQKCTTAAGQATTFGAGLGSVSAAGQTVQIPGLVYVINHAIKVNPGGVLQYGQYTSFSGTGGALIYQTDATSDILVWTFNPGALKSGNFDNVISGLKFRGGRHHIAYNNGNNEGGLLSILDCSFIDSHDYALYGAIDGSTAGNTTVTVERSRFTGCQKIMYTTSAPTNMSHIWITGGSVDTGLINTPSNSALIYVATNCVLNLEDFWGSPVLDEALQQRWIDMHGSNLVINKSRFGGEFAGGVPVAYWFTAPNLSNGFNPPSPTSFIIRDSYLNCGTTNISGNNVGVLNLQTDVPQLMIFQGNSYYFEFPKIVNGGGINFTTYFASMPTHYPFKLSAEPDWQWFGDDTVATGQPPQIPTALRPFLTIGGDVVEGGGMAPRALTLGNGLNSNIVIQQTYKNLLLSGPSAGFSVGGFSDGWQGREIRIMYLGAQTMTLVNADASSTAANRIRTNTGANIVGVHAATFIYDQASTTWVLMSYN